jgi:hypothetical protein
MSTPIEQKKTDFLTILCILSFIGSAVLFLQNLNGYREADLTSDLVMDNVKKRTEAAIQLEGDERKIKKVEQVVEKMSVLMEPARLKRFNLLGMVFNALTFIGALLMFWQRRSGFWAYVLGTIGLVAAPIIAYGTGNFLVYGMCFGFAVVGLVFSLLYSRQLGHMRQ